MAAFYCFKFGLYREGYPKKMNYGLKFKYLHQTTIRLQRVPI